MNLSARTSRRPIYVAIPFRKSRVLMFPVILLFIVSILLITFRHPSCCVSRFCWDCKGRNLFHYVKLFIFYFSRGLNLFKIFKSLTAFYSLRLSNLLLFITLTVPLPPKRDAKVGKNPLPPNNSIHSFVYHA